MHHTYVLLQQRKAELWGMAALRAPGTQCCTNCPFCPSKLRLLKQELADKTNTTLHLSELPSSHSNTQNSRKQNCITLQLGTLKLFLYTGRFILPVWFDLIMWMHFLLIWIPSATLLSFLSLYFPSPSMLSGICHTKRNDYGIHTNNTLGRQWRLLLHVQRVTW